MPRSRSTRHLARQGAALLVAALAAVCPTPAPAQAPGSAAAPTAPAQPPDPGDEIHYQVVPIVSGDATSVTTRLTTIPVLAATGEPLLGADLYLRLGRPDLAAAYEARQTGRGVAAGLGVAIIVGGLIYAATRPGPDVSMPPDQFRRAMDAQSHAQMTGLVVSSGGAVVLVVAALIDPDPVSDVERRELIEAHNRGLGLPGGAPRAEAAEHGPGAPRLTFGAGLLPGGGLARAAVVF